jgi:hypothetical protein
MYPDSNWLSCGNSVNQYQKLLIQNEDKIINNEIYEKMKIICKELNIDSNEITQAYAIWNKKLAITFQNYRDNITGKQKGTPFLFKKEDWQQEKQVSLRKDYLNFLTNYTKQFDFINSSNSNDNNDNNNNELISVIPMIQGTSQLACEKICENGFGVVASRDAGYYGKGILFCFCLL